MAISTGSLATVSAVTAGCNSGDDAYGTPPSLYEFDAACNGSSYMKVDASACGNVCQGSGMSTYVACEYGQFICQCGGPCGVPADGGALGDGRCDDGG
jgi:hypothetical protein